MPGVTPITQDTWLGFPHKAKWDIVVALRGPDSAASEVIKFYTSSIIRAKMELIFGTHGLVNRQWGVIVLPKPFPKVPYDVKIPQYLIFNVEHFFNHVEEAAQYLGIPVAKVPLALWEQTIGQHSYPSIQTIAELLNLVAEPDEEKKHIAMIKKEWEECKGEGGKPKKSKPLGSTVAMYDLGTYGAAMEPPHESE